MMRFIRHFCIAAVALLAVALAWIPGPPYFEPALIALATAASWAFCLLYALLSHGAWIRTRYGRHLMVLTLALALLGTHALCLRLLGPWDWGPLGDSTVHREVIYLILGWQLINRCILLIVSHVKGERRRLAELTRPTRPDREHHHA